MKKFVRRTAPAALLCAGALVLSSTTGAVAAKMITGKQIKDGTVASADLKNGGVKGVDIANGTIGLDDTSVALDNYEQRVGNYQVISKVQPISAGSEGDVTVSCPSGTEALGAFADFENSNLPTATHLGDDYVYAYGRNTSSFDDNLRIQAVCGAVHTD